MKKNDNIFVKLHIEKNRDSGALALNVHFDSETPNFFVDRSMINWYPTPEELEFVNEAFELVCKHKLKGKSQKDKKNSTPLEKHKKEHSSKNYEEKPDESKSDKNKEGESTLSESEKKDMNEWFV